MKSRIVTYKIYATGQPSDDNARLETLCNTLNRNETDKNIIYRVESC